MRIVNKYKPEDDQILSSGKRLLDQRNRLRKIGGMINNAKKITIIGNSRDWDYISL